jgi:polyhydroxyalkanoate synthesis regulator phasin
MLFNRRRRAAWEFEVAVHYLLHDAKELVSLMKEMNADKWPGFIDDILNGARPYEEATAVVGIFLQQSFRNLDQVQRGAIIAAVASNNLTKPPNLLRIMGQVCCHLYLAERDGKVRDKLWTGWLSDLTKTLIETGELTQDQCRTYVLTLANQYREASARKIMSAANEAEHLIRQLARKLGHEDKAEISRAS